MVRFLFPCLCKLFVIEEMSGIQSKQSSLKVLTPFTISHGRGQGPCPQTSPCALSPHEEHAAIVDEEGKQRVVNDVWSKLNDNPLTNNDQVSHWSLV